MGIFSSYVYGNPQKRMCMQTGITELWQFLVQHILLLMIGNHILMSSMWAHGMSTRAHFIIELFSYKININPFL